MNKNDEIKQVFHDLLGCGSIKTTLAEAREIDSSSKLDDVNTRFDNNLQQIKHVIW